MITLIVMLVFAQALMTGWLAACGHSESKSTAPIVGGPTLLPVDSTVLEERDSLYIGLIQQGVSVDQSGSVYVGSAAFRSVLRFRADGRLEMSYRLGDYGGPRSVGPVLYASDSLLFVSDSRASRLFMFRLADGVLIASHRYGGYLGSVDVVADSVWFGNFSRIDRKVVGSVGIAHLLQRDSSVDSALLRPTLISTPVEFAEYPELDLGSQVRVKADGDTVLVAFSALNDVVQLTLSDGKLDTIRPPARVRRGVGTKALAAHFKKDGFRYDRALGSISVTDGVWRRPNGQILIAHLDSHAVMDGRKLVGVSATPYISLVTSDLRRACVDGIIESPSTSRPVMALHRDTLYVVDQRMITSGTERRMATQLRRFLVDDSTCQWIEMAEDR
jgi:hypothetical protein